MHKYTYSYICMYTEYIKSPVSASSIAHWIRVYSTQTRCVPAYRRGVPFGSVRKYVSGGTQQLVQLCVCQRSGASPPAIKSTVANKNGKVSLQGSRRPASDGCGLSLYPPRLLASFTSFHNYMGRCEPAKAQQVATVLIHAHGSRFKGTTRWL